MGRIFFFYRYILTGACLSRVEYAYTTDELGEPLNTVAYGYDDTLGWKDLLTSYGGQARSYDTIGNLISDGVWTYTWPVSYTHLDVYKRQDQDDPAHRRQLYL